MIRAVLFSLALVLLLGACGLIGARSQPGLQPPTAQEGPHVVKVQLSGLPAKEVAVRLGLFSDSEHWLRLAHVFKARLVLSDQPQATVSFYGLPAGTYAIAAFVDTNDNARLDRWLGLVPKEPVAFSEVARFRLPPSFADSAFTVPTSQTIQVQFRQ